MRLPPSKTALLITLLATLFALSCMRSGEQGKQPSQQPQVPHERVTGTRGGSLVYKLTSPPKTFNSLMVSEEYSFTVAFFLIGGRLAEFDHDRQQYVPA